MKTMVTTWRGRRALASNCVLLDCGAHAGKFCHRKDPALHLLFGPGPNGYCLASDERVMVRTSRYSSAVSEYLRSDVGGAVMEDLNNPGTYWLRGLLTYGIIDRRGNHGYFSGGIHCVSNGVYYLNRIIAAAHGVEYSSAQNAYWERGDEDFYGDPDEDDDDDNYDYDSSRSAGYHNLPRKFMAEGARFTVGFEIEKEDAEAIGIRYAGLHQRTGWCKELDGSLSGSRGYELVSPTMDLLSEQLDEFLKDPDLVTLINADYSSSCGGHIHLGKAGATGTELACEVRGYLPLLFAMYPNRARGRGNNYATANKFADTRQGERRALHILHDRIELRIFAAVRSTENLLWRRDLLRYIVANLGATTQEILNEAARKGSDLQKLLRRVYEPQKLTALLQRTASFALEYDDTACLAPAVEHDEAQLTLIDLPQPALLVEAGTDEAW